MYVQSFRLPVSHVLDIPCRIARPDLIGGNVFGHDRPRADNRIFADSHRLAYNGIAPYIGPLLDDYFSTDISFLFGFPEMGKQDTADGDARALLDYNVFGVIRVKYHVLSDKCFLPTFNTYPPPF